MDRYITNLIHGFYGEIRGDIDKFMAFTGRYGEILIIHGFYQIRT